MKLPFISTNQKVFFGGDAAFGPKNVITAVAQGHQAAISMHLMCMNEDINKRPSPYVNIVESKNGNPRMGL
jgi:formate dehydrogenase beta subunit